jgi:Ca2+-binding EF-hand superfamily protein
MKEINNEKLSELKETFENFDKDNNHQIDWDEFRDMLDLLLPGKTLEEKTLAFNLIDSNHDGMINFEEFCDWWGKE